MLMLDGGLAPESAMLPPGLPRSHPLRRWLVAELLPVGGAVNAGTVRNRTHRVGERMARLRPAEAPDPDIGAQARRVRSTALPLLAMAI